MIRGDLVITAIPPRHANQQVREAGVSRKIWMRIQKNLDSAVNPARRPMFDSSLSHSFLLPQRNSASVGTRGHNPRAVVTGFKIYMRCARRTVPPGRKLAP